MVYQLLFCFHVSYTRRLKNTFFLHTKLIVLFEQYKNTQFPDHEHTTQEIKMEKNWLAICINKIEKLRDQKQSHDVIEIHQ